MNVFRFSRLWREATSAPVPTDDVLGPWDGSWRSDGGHRGRLRCVVRGVKDGRLDAVFHAVYWKIFRITYAPTLTVRPAEEGHELAGSWNLGWAFGTFEYEGRVTPARFRARYRASDDTGDLEMTRPRA